MFPTVPTKLLEGKKGLVVGIANDQSIALGLRQGVPCARI
jgi:enoyl-[acyl-carrier-protein] reductase (NADH)